MIAAGDADRGVEAEATGRLPGEHVGDGSLVEKAAAEEELQRAAAQRLLEALDVSGAEVTRRVESDGAVVILSEEPVEDDDVEVEVGVQRRTESVQERDGAELGLGRGARTALAEEGPDRPQEDAEHPSGERGIAGQEGPQPLRQREDPLAHRQRRQDLVAQMGGDLDRAARVAGGADAATLAGEGDQAFGATACAAGAGEPVGQDHAAEVGAEVVLDPSRDRIGERVGAARAGEEALQMMLDDGVKHGGGGLTPAVNGSGGGRRRCGTEAEDCGRV